MLDYNILKNNIIEYKDNNINNPNYTGFDIYKELIPKYIFNNIIISGIFTSSIGTVVPNTISIKNTFVNLNLSQYYPNLYSFTIDFESKLLNSMTFSNPAGISVLQYIVPLKLSTELNNKMANMGTYTYENIVTQFSQIIINNIKNNTILITNSPSGNYTSNSIT